ncbi:hypothetical protein BK133_17220 [Paenibacillus sp. FSL H8-0548]|uniref:hypothetical protein n=1 Tax=Paenibacillus sp. FSL H8-0548 TaxID=1920422 RepID=UPI00096EA7AA|nr:hypothetical protein [Paenibacillus sp. FSL H8-0548]OMF30103.1 hypothetical protein BK133_17220 [Paenibacillus sp. FSL H8-0548]
MFKKRSSVLIFLGVVMLTLAACSWTQDAASKPVKQIQKQPKEEQQNEQIQPAEELTPTLKESAAQVMTALKAGDMNTLAGWLSSDGVRFSPYANINTKTDIVLASDELEGSMADTKKRVWRTFPGTDDLIELTYSEYHKQFVYDADFIKDAEISVNEELGEGAMIGNLNEVYPKDSYDFVEYHIAGTDPSAEGRDWRSLRLVFEKVGDDHIKLAGIIHDQWTP